MQSLNEIYSSRQQLVSATEALLAARGHLLAVEIDAFLRDFQQRVDRLSRNPLLAAALARDLASDTPALRELFSRLASDPNVRGVALLDTAGVVKLGTEPKLEGVRSKGW